MHTLKRLSNIPKNASGKDLELFIVSLCSKSTIPVINELIRLHSKYDVIFVFQETLANIAGICRQHVNKIIKWLVSIGIITKKRRYNTSALYTINPLLIKLKSSLSGLLPALKKCLSVSDLTDAFKKTTSIYEYTKDVNKFHHSAWSIEDQLHNSCTDSNNFTVVSDEVSKIFDGESGILSSSSPGLYINPYLIADSSSKLILSQRVISRNDTWSLDDNITIDDFKQCLQRIV